MATWTKMKIQNLVKIEWASVVSKEIVVCHTVFGDLTVKVSDLKIKLQSPYLLPAIRAIYQDMLDFAEKK